MQPTPHLTAESLTQGHPCVQRQGRRYDVKGANISGGKWNLEGLKIAELNIDDCTLKEPLSLKFDGSLEAIRINNLQGIFQSERKVSPADLLIEMLGEVKRLEITGASNLSMLITAPIVRQCFVKGDFEKIGFTSVRFKEKIELQGVNANDIRFGVCTFENRLELSSIRAHWIVFHMCTFAGASTLLGLERKDERGLLLDIDGCTVLANFLGLTEVKARSIFLGGLKVNALVEVSLRKVEVSDLLDWSHITVAKDASLTFVWTSLAGSYFENTSLERVEIGVDCWDQANEVPRLRIHKLLDKFDPKTLPLRDNQFGYWPMTVPTNEGIQHARKNYSQLVKYYEERREFNLAERFYVGEMEMLRWHLSASPRRWRSRLQRNVSIIGLYNLCSVYGSSYLRAVFVLGGLVIFFAGAFMLAGLSCNVDTIGCSDLGYQLLPVDGATLSISQWLKDFARSCIYVLEVATLQKDAIFEPKNEIGHLLKPLATLLIAAQAALLVFALRRRFRRASSI